MPKLELGTRSGREEVIPVPNGSQSQPRTQDKHRRNVEGTIKHRTLIWCQSRYHIPYKPTTCPGSPVSGSVCETLHLESRFPPLHNDKDTDTVSHRPAE